jgi:hypothetical protein
MLRRRRYAILYGSSAPGDRGCRKIPEESPGSIGQGCRLTACRGDPKESATETNRRVRAARVKWCGKSAPAASRDAGRANPTRSKTARDSSLRRRERPARFPTIVASGARRRASQRDDRRSIARRRDARTEPGLQARLDNDGNLPAVGYSRPFFSASHSSPLQGVGLLFTAPRDRFARRETFVDAVPKRDLRFVHLPAQIDQLPAPQRREIEQT